MYRAFDLTEIIKKFSQFLYKFYSDPYFFLLYKTPRGDPAMGKADDSEWWLLSRSTSYHRTSGHHLYDHEGVLYRTAPPVIILWTKYVKPSKKR